MAPVDQEIVGKGLDTGFGWGPGGCGFEVRVDELPGMSVTVAGGLLERKVAYDSTVGVIMIPEEDDLFRIDLGDLFLRVVDDLCWLVFAPGIVMARNSYYGAKETVGVLHRVVSVIPECSSLVHDGEFIREAPAGWDATATNTSDSVHPGAVLLIDAVPVDDSRRVDHLVVDAYLE